MAWVAWLLVGIFSFEQLLKIGTIAKIAISRGRIMFFFMVSRFPFKFYQVYHILGRMPLFLCDKKAVKARGDIPTKGQSVKGGYAAFVCRGAVKARGDIPTKEQSEKGGYAPPTLVRGTRTALKNSRRVRGMAISLVELLLRGWIFPYGKGFPHGKHSHTERHSHTEKIPTRKNIPTRKTFPYGKTLPHGKHSHTERR